MSSLAVFIRVAFDLSSITSKTDEQIVSEGSRTEKISYEKNNEMPVEGEFMLGLYDVHY